MICNKCGHDLGEYNFCPQCGQQNSELDKKPEMKPDGKAVASMILGICSCVFIFLGLSIPFGIAGLVLGTVSRNSPNKNMALAGIILSITSLALTLIVVLGLFAIIIGVILLIPEEFPNFMQEAPDFMEEIPNFRHWLERI